ncbi:MAG: hypothetical protein RR614_05620 [Eubacterium sp.]
MRSEKVKGRLLSVLLAVLLIFGVVAANPKTAQAVVAPPESWEDYTKGVWDKAIVEFESYGVKGWTDTAANPDIKKWSGEVSTLVANEENGTAETNPMVMPEKDDKGNYDVYYPEQLRYILELAQTKASIITLKNDMDLGGMDTDGVNAVEPKLWTPIILSVATTIKGEDHILYNLNVQNKDAKGNLLVNGGFVGKSSKTFTVSDLHFESVKIESAGSSAVLGQFLATTPRSTISNCSLEHALLSTGNASGGLSAGSSKIAENAVSIERSHTKNVYINGNGGGCCGNLSGPTNGSVKNSYSVDGIVIAAGHAGGFKSCTSGTAFTNCFSNISMFGNGTVGAFIGMDYGSNTFTSCYTSGIVEGESKVGGFAGCANAVTASNYIDCYSTAMVGMEHSISSLGGFLGSYESVKNAKFTRCYAAGEVGNILGTATSMGGFTGANIGTYTNCFYDKHSKYQELYEVNKI